MKIGDLAELAGRNLREALLRNSLTTMGIAVGVASLVAMLSLGVGLQNLANDRLARTGLFDAIFVTPRSNYPGFGRPEGPVTMPKGPPRALDANARRQMEALPHVAEVYPEIRFPTEIHYAGNPYGTVVAGVPESARADGAFDGMKGKFFSSPSADEAILQIDLAKQLSSQPDSLLGKEIVLRYAERQALPPGPSGKDSAGGGISIVPHEKNLRVIGIVETEPAAGIGGFGRGRLLIPLEVAETLQATQANDLRDLLRDGPARRSYESLTVRMNGTTNVKAAEDAIKKMGFSAFSLLDASRNLSLVFAVFDLFLGIFGSLALVVASLGIINTLVMAILERRREIGVLKALGAADRDIRRLFFVEAGAMGLLGGIFGVFIGWLIGHAINFGTNIYLSRRSLPGISVTSVPWWMVAAAIAFSIAVSLGAGIYPASRAARLDPVEALRYE
ncbi:MAG TPA: FtsX-like permease family protein [Verrucomicrobiae bacterium]|nr:FtsX-like permease family protein [Verrucomicrobiae bacterium]